LRNSLVKSDGYSMRYGKLFEILDGLAGDVCYRHTGKERLAEGVSIVTASVARLKLLMPVSLLNDLKLQGYLTYVGKSSMEVKSYRFIFRFAAF
jgi:acyl-coenzyme A thioesterase 9